MELLILFALGVIVFFLLFGAVDRFVGVGSNAMLEIAVCLFATYGIVQVIRHVFLGW